MKEKPDCTKLITIPGKWSIKKQIVCSVNDNVKQIANDPNIKRTSVLNKFTPDDRTSVTDTAHVASAEKRKLPHLNLYCMITSSLDLAYWAQERWYNVMRVFITRTAYLHRFFVDSNFQEFQCIQWTGYKVWSESVAHHKPTFDIQARHRLSNALEESTTVFLLPWYGCVIGIRFYFPRNSEILPCEHLNIPDNLGQYHVCWWPGNVASPGHPHVWYWLHEFGMLMSIWDMHCSD